MAFWEQKIALTLRIAFLICVSFGIGSCTTTADRLPYFNTPNFTPQFLISAPEVTAKITHRIGSFAFTDQHGRPFTNEGVKGKIHVANFIFTKCGNICPVMTRNMKLLQKEFARDNKVVLLSYSVTPWIDSVNVLKEYAERNNITAPNWHLLTGNKNAIYTLARRSYFAEEDLGFNKDNKQFLHTEHVILVDGDGRIRGVYNGTLQLEAMQLVKDIRRLETE